MNLSVLFPLNIHNQIFFLVRLEVDNRELVISGGGEFLELR